MQFINHIKMEKDIKMFYETPLAEAEELTLENNLLDSGKGSKEGGIESFDPDPEKDEAPY